MEILSYAWTVNTATAYAFCVLTAKIDDSVTVMRDYA